MASVSKDAAARRILALGDSYTIGEGVLAAQRWPVQLTDRLRARGLPVADPEIIARTGWTGEELATRLACASLVAPFALVSLLIGANNQYRGCSLEAYQRQFAGLLSRAVTLAGGEPGRVLVLSIPDWGITPFGRASGRLGISAEIDCFNTANRTAAQNAGARYVDITAISRRAANDLTLLACDGLHPSAQMYSAWVSAMLPAVMAILGQSACFKC